MDYKKTQNYWSEKAAASVMVLIPDSTLCFENCEIKKR